jgi:fibronectin type 3 domain-containing protein
MKHETVEKFARSVKNSSTQLGSRTGLAAKFRAFAFDCLRPMRRCARPTALWIWATGFLAGVGVIPPSVAQSTSVLQANSILAGGETRPASTSLQPASALSIEAWVTATTAVTNYPAFVSYGQDSASPYESYILQAQTIDGTHPADFWFLTGSGTSHHVYGTTHLAAGTRYFVVATYDGTTAKIYVNGTLENSASVSGTLYYPGGTGLGLGRKYNAPANNFSGTVQGVAVYSAALTAAQISAHYTAGPPAPLFEMSQVPSGGATQSGSSALQPSSAITVAAWINSPSTLTNYPAFISYGQDTSPYESYILQAQQISGSYPADFFFLTGSGTSHQLRGTTHLTTGTQYFVVATYDGATASLYLNGALQSTLSASGALYYPGGGLGLARKYSTTTSNFTGTESGATIYGTALPVDRIAAQYSAGSPPTIPTSLSATGASSTQINLTWAASTDVVGVTGYLIERCQGTGCTSFVQVANGTATSYNDTGLSASTSYSYRVRAVNAGNNVSDYSSTASALTTGGGGDTTPPATPSGLVATVVSGNQINLSWTASTDNVGVTGYLIERCQGSGCSTFTQIATSATNSYSNTGLTSSTSYTYRVRATDAAGNLSGYSNTAAATTGSSGDTTPPSAPTGLAASAGGSVISLSWTASADNVGVTGYLIERCQGSGCSTFTQIGTSSTNSYSDTGLTPSTSYTYRVRATDAAGNLSGYSNTASATTTSGLSSPTGLTIIAASSSEIDLAWIGSSGGSGSISYRIERCSGVGCGSFSQVGAPSATAYSDAGLSASTSYSYRVRASDSVGDLSGYSGVVTYSTPVATPDCQ